MSVADAERIDPRRPPWGAIIRLHLPREPGKCDWCGKPQEERTPVRKQLKIRHAACDTELAIICQPEQARFAVFRRDQGVCCDCREDWSERYRFGKGAGVIIIDGSSDRATNHERSIGFWRYTEVIWISLWHVDHRVPLWKVAHMPAVQRIEYFKLAALVTRCEPCHKFKTKKEAAERAKVNQQVEDQLALPSPPPSRKIQSRGFDKSLRRKMNGKTEKRAP